MTNEDEIIKKDSNTPVTKMANEDLGTYVPSVDIFDTPDETILEADMPGIDESSVEVVLEDNVLSISGKRKSDIPTGYNASYKEYCPTEFMRRFEVSHEIEKGKIKATVKNGVLRLVLLKGEHTKPKKIPISSN
jgi:HSP20 family molecular chaperone IbpA